MFSKIMWFIGSMILVLSVGLLASYIVDPVLSMEARRQGAYIAFGYAIISIAFCVASIATKFVFQEKN